MVDADFKEPDKEAAVPKKGNLTIIIIIVVTAIVMGTGGFFAGKILSTRISTGNMSQTGDVKASGETIDGNREEVITGDEMDAKSEKKRKKGFLPLETFTVNLNDPFGKRYVECTLNLVLNDRDLVTDIKENELVMAKIRHDIFMTISARSYTELKSTAGKITLFEEIQMRVNEILKEEMEVEPVLEVLQTKFLMQ